MNSGQKHFGTRKNTEKHGPMESVCRVIAGPKGQREALAVRLMCVLSSVSVAARKGAKVAAVKGPPIDRYHAS